MADLDRLFPGEGEMARRVRAHDWAASPLGPVERWPAALVNALSLLLPAQAEIVLFWGAEYVALYNDAYSPTIGDKHPRALGCSARECWAELWDDLEPLLRHVRETGETYSAKDRPFYIERRGYGEEVFFDISYSAVRVEDGSVGGVLCIVSETTERVRAARASAADLDRLRVMFDAAPGFMAVLREPGHVVELANEAYRALVGDRPLIGLPIATALPEVGEQGFIARLDEVVARAQPFTGTGVAVELDRGGTVPERRVLDFIYQPITDVDGQVTGVFVEGVDVTDRDAALRDLALHRESLELATEAAGMGVWDLDVASGQLVWDARTHAHFDVPLEEAVSLDLFFERLHPDDREPTRAAFEAALDPTRRAVYDVEYRVRWNDGDTRWIAARGRALFDAAGRCQRAVGTTVDITARRAEAEALRESEERFRTLADSLPALVWVTDAEGAMLFCNAGFERLLGVPPDEMVRGGWALVIPPEDHAELERRFRDRLGSPRVYAGDYRVRSRAGEKKWIHGEARPRYVGERFVGYVACAIDVTEAHLAGEALEARIAERTGELTRQIEEREKVEATLHQMQRLEAVGQLTSGVAHDFNNLLTVVLGNVDMLERAAAREGADARQVKRLDHVRQAAERGARLTQQLLAFSRRQRLEAKAVDLNEVIAGMVDLLGSTLGRAIAIETRTEPRLWPALVDPTQIELIILNLAINARDAMPAGGSLTVSTGNVVRGVPDRPEEPPAGDYVMVSVADDGTGMEPATLARAFEPFFTTKEVGKGSGLGLAQVFGFAKQSGGGVRIDTAPGEGTTVSVFLPRAGERGHHDTAMAERVPASAIAGRTLLVLDDEDGVRDVTAEALRDAGCRVVEASDGASALRALQHEPSIDGVVADVAMPGMNGVEFARRAQLRRPGLPVVFVTGYADLAAIADVPEERIVRKPYRREALVERVRQMLAEA